MSTTGLVRRGPKSVAGDVEYHRVLAGEKRRIGRGILAIVLLVGGMFGAIQVLFLLGAMIDQLIRPEGAEAPGGLTPVTFASTLAATALLIPWSMLLQRWLYGVRGPSLHSVVSRFRFDLFGRALLIVLPLMLIALAITEFLEPRGSTAWSSADLVAFAVVIVLLVPLQSAGEEYAVRGLVFRVTGSWAHGRWASLILGIVVSTAVFAVIHAAGDVWWNVFYVLFSLTTGLVTWRTGGVEIAAVIHAVYNVVTMMFWLVLHADFAERFDRSAGAVTPALIVPSTIAFIAVTVIVWLSTRRSGPARTPAA
jgi:membrane protease YdiL (CAAX protease family)